MLYLGEQSFNHFFFKLPLEKEMGNRIQACLYKALETTTLDSYVSCFVSKRHVLVGQGFTAH